MNTFYIATTGSDTTGDGSLAHPWATIPKATGAYPTAGPMVAGDTLIIRGGLYRVPYLFFWPGGVSSSQRTTFRAYTGERPVFTGVTSISPPVDIAHSYVDVDGLWMGGNTEDAGSAIVLDGFQVAGGETFHKAFKNCVIWNYPYVAIGHHDYAMFQACKFWGCGSTTPPSPSDFTSTIYFRGKDGADNDQGNHALVDHCILLNNAHDFFINLSRVFNSTIVTRNFLGNGPLGMYDLGNGALIANNIFWKGTGGGVVALDPKCSYARIWNNIFDRSSMAIYIEAGLSDQLVGYNAYDPSVTTMGYPASNDVHYSSAGVIPLTKTRAQIDAAISAIAVSFAADVAIIANDATLDTNFALLSELEATPGGAFKTMGFRWCDAQPATVDIGPTLYAPASEDDFWKAYYIQNLPSYDADGVGVNIAYPPLNIPPESTNW